MPIDRMVQDAFELLDDWRFRGAVRGDTTEVMRVEPEQGRPIEVAQDVRQDLAAIAEQDRDVSILGKATPRFSGQARVELDRQDPLELVAQGKTVSPRNVPVSTRPWVPKRWRSRG